MQKMSSIESASMPGPDVSDKTSVDFGGKAVCLKSQGDSARLIQGVGQNRSIGQGGVGATSGLAGVPVLSSISTQKTALARVTTSTVQASSASINKIPITSSSHPVTTASTVSHVTSYHVPRGPAQVANMATRPTSGAMGRPSVTLQPVGVASASAPGLKGGPPSAMGSRAPSPMPQSGAWTPGSAPLQPLNNVMTVPRCISPSSTAPRTFVPARTSSTTAAATKAGPSRSGDTSRPLLLHAAPQKPMTLTTGTPLHITTDKTIKVPPGAVAQVVPLRPPVSGFMGPSQATILQSGVSTTTVLSAPVRINVTGAPQQQQQQQPPLLSTQRVAVSAPAGTVLASRIAVSSVSPASAQTVTLGAQARIPAAMNQGTIIATSNRLGASSAATGTPVLPPQARLAVQPVQTVQAVQAVGQGAILSTPGRLGPYPAGQLLTGQSTVLASASRITSSGTTVLSTSKVAAACPTTLLTTSSRVPVTSATLQLANHQTTRSVATTTTAASRLAAATSRAPAPLPTASAALLSTSTRLAVTPAPPPIVVHPQIMVSTSCGPGPAALKPVHGHGGNHVAPARALQIHNSTAGQKVLSQPLHGPIQITQSPVNIASSKATSQPGTQNTVQTTITTVAAKQMCFTPTTAVTTRPVAVVASPSTSIPIAKIYPQSIGVSTESESASSQTPSVFIQTSHRALSSPGMVCSQPALSERSVTAAPTLSTYTLPGGASYYYEAPSGYQLATDAPLVARPLSPDAALVSRQLSSEGPLIARPYTPGNGAFVSQASAATVRSTTLPSHGLMTTAQPMRFNPVMIVDSPVAGQPFTTESSTLLISDSALVHQASGAVSKLTSSPRPSILRKRDNEASPAKAVKNLTPMLSSASVSRSASPSPPSLHLETNQQSNEHGPSSNGSTTISATSSPGLDDTADTSMPAIKTEFNDDSDRPPVEMSPRKKPRKQLLNDANDAIEMEFISDDRIKKERDEEEPPLEKVYVVKKPNVSLLHSYKHNWKSRHNHFMRYSDVKPKDERRATVTDLANQKQVVQKVNGWKIYHLSTQMEDLSEMESHVLDRLSTMLRAMDKTLGKDLEKDVNRVNDLIMGNIQRSKVIKDQMQEAKTQMMKVFDHKVHVSEIISRCASKRNFKKREKY